MTFPNHALRQWADARRLALARQAVRVAAHAVVDPRYAGGYASVGLPLGQRIDVRFPPEPDCRGVHAQRFGDEWRVHVDQVHPACDLVEHVRRDAPGAWVAATAALGAVVGGFLGKNSDAAFSGALLGALVGAATHADAGDRL